MYNNIKELLASPTKDEDITMIKYRAENLVEFPQHTKSYDGYDLMSYDENYPGLILPTGQKIEFQAIKLKNQLLVENSPSHNIGAILTFDDTTSVLYIHDLFIEFIIDQDNEDLTDVIKEVNSQFL